MRWWLFIILILLSQCLEKDVPSEFGEEEFAKKRHAMVQKLIEVYKLEDQRVLEAMRVVPRHKFVPNSMKKFAYDDTALPIGYGQTISQPYIVGLMTQELKIKDGDKVLEIGTGSGYQAAVLLNLTKHVYTIEIIKELHERSNKCFEELGYKIHTKNADGYFGWKEEAPFDAIIITAAVDHPPRPLFDQLKIGGRLILPMGSPYLTQTLTLIEKGNDTLSEKKITEVRFVPMTGVAMK
jgi:protein-L-isoaspartate(D-aspartate) O-methyltransferase